MILFKVNFSFLEVFSAEKNGEIVEFSCLHKKRIHGFKHKTVIPPFLCAWESLDLQYVWMSSFTKDISDKIIWFHTYSEIYDVGIIDIFRY